MGMPMNSYGYAAPTAAAPAYAREAEQVDQLSDLFDMVQEQSEMAQEIGSSLSVQGSLLDTMDNGAWGDDDDDELECFSSEEEAEGDADPFALILDDALRTVDKIIMLQSASGSWASGPALDSVLGVDTSAGAPSGTDPLVWSTALAIAYLQTRLADDRDEWTLLVEKALRWLRGAGVDVDAVLGAARDAHA